MTTAELIDIYESASVNKARIFGVPGGALKPTEAAGKLIKQHGPEGALEEAKRKKANNPAPWNFWAQVYDELNRMVA